MVAFSKYNCFSENLAEKVHNLGSDTLKIALTNTAPNVAHTNLSQIGEISAGNGYTAGGNADVYRRPRPDKRRADSDITCCSTGLK